MEVFRGQIERSSRVHTKAKVGRRKTLAHPKSHLPSLDARDTLLWPMCSKLTEGDSALHPTLSPNLTAGRAHCHRCSNPIGSLFPSYMPSLFVCKRKMRMEALHCPSLFTFMQEICWAHLQQQSASHFYAHSHLLFWWLLWGYYYLFMEF